MTIIGGSEMNKNREINKKSVVIFNNNEANSYETIKYNSSDVEKGVSSEIDTNELIKCAYANGDIEIKNNDMAVFSVADQFILYTFDIKSGNVVNEKKYTKMQSEGRGALRTKNDMGLRIGIMKPDDKYIYCVVDGYFSEKDKELNTKKLALFVFDWDLNPIRKFDLPMQKNSKYILSNDCKSIYIGEFRDEVLLMSKADLNI